MVRNVHATAPLQIQKTNPSRRTFRLTRITSLIPKSSTNVAVAPSNHRKTMVAAAARRDMPILLI
jgi:hypothetical protein